MQATFDSRSLDTRVQIKSKAADQDAAGQPVDEWLLVVEVWANILHLNGAESIRADKETSVVPASIRIRARRDITAAMRVYHGTTAYEIKAVPPQTRGRQFIDLVCKVVRA